jgi:hypothetical protein
MSILDFTTEASALAEYVSRQKANLREVNGVVLPAGRPCRERGDAQNSEMLYDRCGRVSRNPSRGSLLCGRVGLPNATCPYFVTMLRVKNIPLIIRR